MPLSEGSELLGLDHSSGSIRMISSRTFQSVCCGKEQPKGKGRTTAPLIPPEILEEPREAGLQIRTETIRRATGWHKKEKGKGGMNK